VDLNGESYCRLLTEDRFGAAAGMKRLAMNLPAPSPAGHPQRDEPFRTPRFHRTLSDWVEMIARAGLAIERFVEPSASAGAADAEPVAADTRIAPISLLIRLRKPI
jgi:hypothetical protein